MATYLYEAQRRRYGAPSAAEPPGGALNDKLHEGDTLVVSGVGCLGESYAEISDALRNLMRRHVRVRVINERHTFDGFVEDPRAQASRDSLIASAAATAEIEKTVKGDIATRPVNPNEPAWPQLREKVGDSSVLQLCVVAAQIGVLALAAHFMNLGAQRPSRIEPTQVAVIDDPRKEANSPSFPRYATNEFLVERGNATRQSEPKQEKILPKQQAISGEGQSVDKQSTDAQTIPLSTDRAHEIFAVVGEWRSARLKTGVSPISVGVSLPLGVHLAIFPRGLVRETPALRGYRFVVAGRLICIVDPVTRKIVSVLDGQRA